MDCQSYSFECCCDLCCGGLLCLNFRYILLQLGGGGFCETEGCVAGWGLVAGIESDEKDVVCCWISRFLFVTLWRLWRLLWLDVTLILIIVSCSCMLYYSQFLWCWFSYLVYYIVLFSVDSFFRFCDMLVSSLVWFFRLSSMQLRLWCSIFTGEVGLGLHVSTVVMVVLDVDYGDYYCSSAVRPSSAGVSNTQKTWHTYGIVYGSVCGCSLELVKRLGRFGKGSTQYSASKVVLGVKCEVWYMGMLLV